eukprot:6943308-Lingulodinium_polyedra.AAC.1
MRLCGSVSYYAQLRLDLQKLRTTCGTEAALKQHPSSTQAASKQHPTGSRITCSRAPARAKKLARAWGARACV